MSTIYLMIPVTLLLAGGFLLAYIWAVRSGQFEDTQTPAMRILPDETIITPNPSASEKKQHHKTK